MYTHSRAKVWSLARPTYGKAVRNEPGVRLARGGWAGWPNQQPTTWVGTFPGPHRSPKVG
eukprot:1175872-Prorocentrum_minimum.AAC.1